MILLMSSRIAHTSTNSVISFPLDDSSMIALKKERKRRKEISFAQSEVKKYLRIKLRRARMPRERYRRDFRNMAGFLPMKINRERNREDDRKHRIAIRLPRTLRIGFLVADNLESAASARIKHVPIARCPSYKFSKNMTCPSWIFLGLATTNRDSAIPRQTALRSSRIDLDAERFLRTETGRFV